MQTWEQNAAAVIRGESEPDLLLTGGQVVNTFSGELLPANVAILQNRICYVGPDIISGPKTYTIDCSGRYLCPGFIEPHTHPWFVYGPAALAAFSAARGTTTLVGENLPPWTYFGREGFRNLVDAASRLPARYYWWVRMATNSARPEGRFGPAVADALRWPEVVGTGELTNWPLLTAGDEWLLSLMGEALRLGKRVDGHTAGASYRRLAALAATGVSGCHEAITGPEALNRLRLGYWTMLRQSSLRPDLPELAQAVATAGVDTRRLLFTQDAPSPTYLIDNGAMDDCVRRAIAAGLSTMQAIQAATINPATYLGLDQWIGGIAPGRYADIQILPNLETFIPEQVYLGGRLVAENGQCIVPAEPPMAPGGWRGPNIQTAADPNLYSMSWTGPHPIPVMHFESTVITRRRDLSLPMTDARINLGDFPELCHAVYFGDEGRVVTHGVVSGLMQNLDGLATTLQSVDGLLVLGRRPQAMALAASTVVQSGGGIALVDGEQLVSHIPLPWMGCSNDGSMPELARLYANFTAEMNCRGYAFGDPGYSLIFLSAQFLPDLRLTAAGLLEVKTGKILVPSHRL